MADYSNLLASYGSARSADLGQDLGYQNRAKLEYQREIQRQRDELKKKSGFWNKLGSAVTGGITSGVGQGVSGMVSTAINPSQMLGGAKGAVPTGPTDGGNLNPNSMGNGYANYLAQSGGSSGASSLGAGGGVPWAGGDESLLAMGLV